MHCPLHTCGNQAFIGVSLSEPHTSVTALQDACVCMSVCVWPYTKILIERTRRSLMKVDTMDLSLSNFSPMVATADHERQGQAAHRQYRQITHSS